MAEYFSVTTSKRENEASRIIADMRFAFIDGPQNSMGLLKTFQQLVLASNDHVLEHYFFQYFKQYEDVLDSRRFYKLDLSDSDEIVIEEMKNRIENYLHPERQRQQQLHDRLGIPKNQVRTPISVKIISHPKPIESDERGNIENE